MWLRNAVRNFWRKQRADELLDEEVRGYAELLAAEKIKEGMQPRYALREAKMELGGVEQVKEQTREVRAGRFLETLWQDLRYGVRMLVKNPGFTIVAVLTLALGIGSNTAIFSIVQNVLLQPLPYSQPSQLVDISNSYQPNVSYIGLSPGDYADWRRQATSFSDMAAYVTISQGFNLTGNGQAQRVLGSYASASLFPMLGIRPVAGRGFSQENDKTGGAPSVILSHKIWTSVYGGDPGIVGHAIQLDNDRYTVVGVLPAGFQLLRWADLWMPIGQFGDDLTSHVHHDFNVIARMKPGVTPAQAQAEMVALNHQE